VLVGPGGFVYAHDIFVGRKRGRALSGIKIGLGDAGCQVFFHTAEFGTVRLQGVIVFYQVDGVPCDRVFCSGVIHLT